MEKKILINNITTYRRIVLNNYDYYCKCKNNINTINGSISMGPDGDKFFNKLLIKKYEFATQIIIFSALSIEAFINDYLIRYLDINYFNSLDKLEVKNKLVIGIRMVLNKDFPKDKKAYNYFSNLISLRNKLVHCKSFNFDFDNLIDNYLIEIDEKEIDHALQVYNLIIKELLVLQPDLDESYLKKNDDIRDWYYINSV